MNTIDNVVIRLVKENYKPYSKSLNTPEDVAEFLREQYSDMDREIFGVINFTVANKPININIVSMGAINASICIVREVFKTSILSNASHIIVFHNHPSGCVAPSQQDIKTTQGLVKAGGILGIKVYDHIIIGTGSKEYFSFLERDMIEQ